MNIFDYKGSHRQIAVLIDPQKKLLNKEFIEIINQSLPDYILVGGSQKFSYQELDDTISNLKSNTDIPIVLFPGDNTQIHKDADALLALSVIQASNNNFIFTQLIDIVSEIEKMNIDVYYTPYILGVGAENTSVSKVLNGEYEKIKDVSRLEQYLKALKLLNPSCIYLEAGSGAGEQIGNSWINSAMNILDHTYIIVGGGIKNNEDIKTKWDNGAHCVVVGNHLEEHPEALLDMCKFRDEYNNKEC